MKEPKAKLEAIAELECKQKAAGETVFWCLDQLYELRQKKKEAQMLYFEIGTKINALKNEK